MTVLRQNYRLAGVNPLLRWDLALSFKKLTRFTGVVLKEYALFCLTFECLGFTIYEQRITG